MIRRRYVFRGMVQGVGFRYHARYHASALGLTGWVRNEYDGSVTMEVQGDVQSIDRLIAELQGDRYIDILDVDVRSVAVDPEERRFRVAHS